MVQIEDCGRNIQVGRRLKISEIQFADGLRQPIQHHVEEADDEPDESSDENPMQLASVETKQYNVDGTLQEDKIDSELSKTQRTQNYEFDADGNLAQHIEYIPYGEVFVEERNSQFSTNFLFNAKELDNETGLYYYGARYLDPTGAMWLSVDPLFEKYAGMSPYNYCAGNPVKYIDPDGNVFETAWDLFNVALDIKSLGENLSNGNYGAAFVDGLSLIGDGAAVILPGVPGGFGTAVKAARATDKAIRQIR